MPDKEKALKKRGKRNVKHSPEPVRGEGMAPAQGLAPKLTKGAPWWAQGSRVGTLGGVWGRP